MICLHCNGTQAYGTLTLDKGLVLRVVYCMKCERVQRIGSSVPDCAHKVKQIINGRGINRAKKGG